MKNSNIKLRLTAMNFLEFAVWGAYLTSMGNYLAGAGLAENIGWFYSVQGIVSLFMPALLGLVADRWIQAQKLLGISHFLAGVFMIAAGSYAITAGSAVQMAPLFTLYTISVAFYMPTLALSNSVAFNGLVQNGYDTVKAFPPIRVFGTIGFICTMLVVDVTGLQSTPGQFFVSGGLSLLLACYALTLPKCPVNKGEGKSLSEALGLKAFSLFKQRNMAVFFIFSMLLGVCLQITNSYANPFITSFKDLPEYAGAFFTEHANMLISLSQISETLCILLIPFFLKRFGIKKVMMMSMLAWVLRFGLFGVGNPAMPGVILFILSCIVYGVAFDFFNISGALFVEQNTDEDARSGGQGLFMMMTNGFGATIGTLAAQAIINHYVYSQKTPQAMNEGWQTSWFIFAAYALVVLLFFVFIFRDKKGKAVEKESVGCIDKEGKAVENESAGCIGLGFSFFFPIIGIILYFTKKSKKFDASGYLYAAVAGFILGFILRVATGLIH